MSHLESRHYWRVWRQSVSLPPDTRFPHFPGLPSPSPRPSSRRTIIRPISSGLDPVQPTSGSSVQRCGTRSCCSGQSDNKTNRRVAQNALALHWSSRHRKKRPDEQRAPASHRSVRRGDERRIEQPAFAPDHPISQEVESRVERGRVAPVNPATRRQTGRAARGDRRACCRSWRPSEDGAR